MKSAERILKALANRRRIAIVKYLKAEREAPVGDIASEIRLSFRSTSRHLAVLVAAGILEREQRGLQVYYRLTPSQNPLARAVINSL